MGSDEKRLFRGSIVRITGFFAGSVTGLLLMPFIIHSLGDKMYGLWIFVGSFLGYYGLMDFGLSSATLRYISRATGANDHDEENHVINTSLYIFTIIGAFALFVSLLAALFVPLFIRNISDVKTFRILILVLGLSFSAGLPLRTFFSILRAHLRYDLNSMVELCLLFVRTAAIVIFLKQGFGILALAFITFGADICGYVSQYLLVRRLYPYIRVSRALVDRTKFKTLFDYSIHTFISQIADQLRFNVDNLVIVTFIGLNEVTLFSIASRLIAYFQEFMTSALGITLPLFSKYEGRGDLRSIQEQYLFLTKIGSYLSLLVGSIMIIFGKFFILRWVGEKYSEAYTILLILLIPFLFNLMQSAAGGLLFGLSKHKYYTVTNSIEGVSNLALSIILAKHYGIYGVALGTAIPMLIIKIFVQPVYTCRTVNLKLSEFYVKLFLPVILLSAGIFGIFWLAVRGFIIPDYLNILGLSSLGAVLFVYAAYSLGFTDLEKDHIRNGFGLNAVTKS